MAKVERFEDLRCWQSARKVVYAIYQLKKYNALSKDYDTFRQLKRAALSVMNNIAEGFARYHPGEFSQFLNIAQSSAAEVKSILYVLEDLSYCPKSELSKIHQSVDNTRKSILALIKHIQKRKSNSQIRASEPSIAYTRKQTSNHQYTLALPKKYLLNLIDDKQYNP
ncbi:MAG: four helix bundle protein [Tunicatimonas sp.]|uniref:four helix bundle protein n=1 Tax=Tunicatimonas sp. TaxID=1940096 RepID=UPI003C70A9C5